MKNPKFKDVVLWTVLLMLSSVMMAGMFQEMNLGWMTLSCWITVILSIIYLISEWIEDGLYQGTS